MDGGRFFEILSNYLMRNRAVKLLLMLFKCLMK